MASLAEIPNIVLAMSPIFVYLYLASLGNSVVEKSGILNLAIDGAYTLGIALVFTLLVFVGDPTLALLITSFLIGLLGVLVAFLTTKLPI
ncbi:MAG: ABC transporter permease, partial [Zestosphaera sp.]